jgi:ferredoxin
MSLRYYTCAITLELDASRCIGCGRCVEVCPHDVFRMIRPDSVRHPAGGPPAPAGRTVHPRLQSTIAARDRCMECGACARNCEAGAITAGSGVGCAAAIIHGLIRGTSPDCHGSCGQGPAEPGCGAN